jgi:NTP pyrophosphatase (non-canonical NTP hydrolase)
MSKDELEKYKDTRLRYFGLFKSLIESENECQLDKWGIQERTLPEWLMYATEEFGEFSKAINEYIYRDGMSRAIIEEAIQVVTLCLKIADMIMENANIGVEGK